MKGSSCVFPFFFANLSVSYLSAGERKGPEPVSQVLFLFLTLQLGVGQRNWLWGPEATRDHFCFTWRFPSIFSSSRAQREEGAHLKLLEGWLVGPRCLIIILLLHLGLIPTLTWGWVILCSGYWTSILYSLHNDYLGLPYLPNGLETIGDRKTGAVPCLDHSSIYTNATDKWEWREGWMEL